MFFASNRNVRRYQADMMTYRTKDKESSDSEDDKEGKDLFGDFRKKFPKL